MLRSASPCDVRSTAPIVFALVRVRIDALLCGIAVEFKAVRYELWVELPSSRFDPKQDGGDPYVPL